MFRWQDDNHWTLQLRSTASVGDHTLVRRSAGTATTIVATGHAPVVSDVLVVSFIGSAITLTVNGVQIINTAPSTFQGNTQNGIYANSTAATVSAWAP